MAFLLHRHPRQARQPRPEPQIKAQAELIAEAKADTVPTLNSPIAAAFKPSAIWRRYSRHQLADGESMPLWVSVPKTFWPAGVAGILAAALLLGIFLFIGSNLITSTPSALIIGGVVGWYMAVGKMWSRAYGTLHISQNPDSMRPWQSTQFMRLNLPRLIFKERQNEVFYGSYEKGYMRVETTDIDLTTVTEQRTFYDMSPGVRQMSEGPLVDGHSRMRSTEGNGLAIHKTKSKSISERLSENWGFIVGVIFIVIAAYCLLQMQEGELLGRPDVAEYQEQVELQRQREAASAQEQREAAMPPQEETDSANPLSETEQGVR